MKIKIIWLTDEHECDTCGSSYAEGAQVFINDKLELDLKPVANCFGGDHWYPEDVYREILEHLGYEIETQYGKDEDFE